MDSVLRADKKYLRIADLLFAFVWNLGDRNNPITYALTHAETVTIAETMGWTLTDSWNGPKGFYSTTAPSKRLLALLDPYRTKEGTWWKKVTGSAQALSATLP